MSEGIRLEVPVRLLCGPEVRCQQIQTAPTLPPPLSCMSGFLERSTVPNKQAWLRKVLSDNHVS